MIFRILQQACRLRANRNPVNTSPPRGCARAVNRVQGRERGQMDYMKVLSSGEFTRFNVYREWQDSENHAVPGTLPFAYATNTNGPCGAGRPYAEHDAGPSSSNRPLMTTVQDEVMT